MIQATTEEDVNVMGGSNLPGGRYRRINVMGDLRMDGDIRCLSMNCMGDATVVGSFQGQKTNVMGDMEFRGPVDAGILNVMGEAKCLSGLRARTANCMGEVEVVGTLNADRLNIFGELRVTGDCNVDRLDSRGGFRIDGLLSGDQLRIVPWHQCHAAEVGGSRIEVCRRRGFLGVLLVWDSLMSAVGLGRDRGLLEVESIEGDEVLLENTTAHVVRGKRVRIGTGCRIGRVEHGGDFASHPSAQIGEVAIL
jgi:cytoskeletal protein CcmA (bactofilin family)